MTETEMTNEWLSGMAMGMILNSISSGIFLLLVLKIFRLQNASAVQGNRIIFSILVSFGAIVAITIQNVALLNWFLFEGFAPSHLFEQGLLHAITNVQAFFAIFCGFVFYMVAKKVTLKKDSEG